MAGASGENSTTVEFTPTWIVAAVCTIIVFISLLVERILHYAGKYLKKKNQKPLFEALQKVKEELMLLGFISLLLTVFQDRIAKICIPKHVARHLLPCKRKEEEEEVTSHFQTFFSPFISGNGRRLLAEDSGTGYCDKKQSFLKQFYGSVTKSDYITLRLGFIRTHCRGSPKYNFHKYMIRAFESDFKRVVGISWYLWIFVVIFLLLNVNGWHTYFWIGFIPFVLLLAVGTKLEHVITQLAHDVAEKHIAIEGDLVVQPSDDHFWFHRPRMVLILIHIILFQNSFEMAFFFWVWVQYGFDSCIMDHLHFIIIRLVIGVFIQVLCSYSTLPLYAIVTHMGTSFNKAIFDEHVQEGLVSWAQGARRKKGLRAAAGAPSQVGPRDGSSGGIQLEKVVHNESATETRNAGGIEPAS
ncbi:hypothetical protein HHK36_013399 [Tetracentron sinense]|uniref:MLO-like protein n=1 Tax=Tetracentron sinense TaxID=13715 RepID=A0A834ZC60_TETSI|nr:hypothetical protein HHK36_013399 [Tetracentron sinense]